MNYLDSHCHINDVESYKDDLNEVLEKMVSNDVLKCLIISLNPKEYEIASSISHPQIKFKKSIGIYPEDIHKYKDEELNRFYEIMKQDDCCAIGEIGLDYHWCPDTKDDQKKWFIKQIEIANKLNKPIIVHSRDAIQDTFDILKEHPCKGVIHCYSSSAELAKEFVKLGYYISLAGTCTWKNAKEPLEVIKVVPLNKLLIETDSPYLTPAPNRGKRNDPSNVIYVGKKIMEIKGISEEELTKQINENYDTLFGK